MIVRATIVILLAGSSFACRTIAVLDPDDRLAGSEHLVDEQEGGYRAQTIATQH
jgi:hypothetical protein